MECSGDILYPEMARKVNELVEGDENAFSQNTIDWKTNE